MLEVAQRIPKACREAKTIKGFSAKEAVAKQVPMLKGPLRAGVRETNPGASRAAANKPYKAPLCKGSWLRGAETEGLLYYHFG